MSAAPQGEEVHTPANGFNAADVKAFLGRVAKEAPASYKVQDSRNSGNVWAAKGEFMTLCAITSKGAG